MLIAVLKITYCVIYYNFRLIFVPHWFHQLTTLIIGHPFTLSFQA